MSEYASARQAALEKNNPVRVGGGPTMHSFHSNVTPGHFVTIECVWVCVDVCVCVYVL